MDNYYKNCPPRMSDGRFTTNYKSATCNNEYIKFTNNITRDDDYRLFLQTNGVKMMDSEWLNLKQNDSCWNNACVHKYPLRMDPRNFVQERTNADLLFKSKELPMDLKCDAYSDYRMSQTPLQNYQINSNECTSCAKNLTK